MSVPASNYKVQYLLTNALAALAIPFYFVESSHVRVIRTRNDVDLPLTSGFSIAGAGVEAGGTLTLDGTQAAIGDRITIKRNVPFTQLIRYLANDKFPASTHERGLDEGTMRAQVALEVAERGLNYGEGEVVGAANRLPDVPTRERKILAFDTAGRVDMNISAEDVNTLIVANPVNALTDVTDYGSVGDPVTDVADYGSIA